MKALIIKISGSVQGVGFRFFANRQAEKFGVSGMARNLDDGSVEIEAEGEEAVLEKFIEKLKKGPLFSKVTNVVVEEGELKNFKDFKIEWKS